MSLKTTLSILTLIIHDIFHADYYLQRHNFFEKKNKICCHHFVKSLNSEFIVIFLLLFMNHIITVSQATSFHMLNHFSAFHILQINNTDISAFYYFFYILL